MMMFRSVCTAWVYVTPRFCNTKTTTSIKVPYISYHVCSIHKPLLKIFKLWPLVRWVCICSRYTRSSTITFKLSIIFWFNLTEYHIKLFFVLIKVKFICVFKDNRKRIKTFHYLTSMFIPTTIRSLAYPSYGDTVCSVIAGNINIMPV